jgi:hypothetical protein
MPKYLYTPLGKEVTRHHTDREVRMESQGRLVKVMFVLIFAMSAGALILLALEGKPIKPLPFSLASQMRLNSPDHALGTEIGIQPGRWLSVEVSYRPNQGQLSQRYGLVGELAESHHFVIADPSSGNDGQIYASQRWVKQLSCKDSPDNPLDKRTIRICLLTGDPSRPISSNRQAQQLDNLVSTLVKYCRIEPKVVWNPN